MISYYAVFQVTVRGADYFPKLSAKCFAEKLVSIASSVLPEKLAITGQTTTKSATLRRGQHASLLH